MNKRLLSIILIITMLFSFMPLSNMEVYAQDSEKQIKVRVEGKENTLFDEEITVTSKVYEDHTVTDIVYGIDLLETAIGEENFDGTESQYGLLINELLGESAGESGEGYSTSWGVYIEKDGELQSASTGISSLKVDNIDELLLHIKATNPSTYADLTFIPKLETTQKDGNTEFTVKRIVTTYDENWSPIVSEELIKGANLKINGIEYTTDSTGKVEISLEEGRYDVKVYKEGDNYPELVRRTFDITVDQSETVEESIKVRVEGFENTLYNQQISYSFTETTKPLDVLREAVGVENIGGTEDPSMGYFITEILGESHELNRGWTYYVKDINGNIIRPMVGVDRFDGMTNLDGECIIDELVFCMAAYSGSSVVTKIPVVSVKQDGSQFTIKVVNNEVGNEPIKNVDIKVGTEGTYKTNENGEASFTLNKAGIYDVEISKDIGYPEIVRQYMVLESEGGGSQELQHVIDELKEMYQVQTDLKAIEVMAYNSLMNDEKDYITSFQLNDSENAGAYAENIMGLLATGGDPNFYVDGLVNAQNEEGIFVVGGNDENSTTNLADSITALDMSKAEYDVEKAVKALVSSANSGHYEDVATTAYALRALLKHKDIEGVEGLIISSIAYLQSEQLDGGGYDAHDMGNSPYATGPAIQALIRAEEDLSSEDWIKGSRTLVDALIACKVEDKGFELAEGLGGGDDDPTATQLAFTALSDVYGGISMYDRFTLESSDEEKDYEKIIDEAIAGIREHLTSMETRMDSNFQSKPVFYRPLEALGLNVTSDDIKSDVEDIAKKFVLNDSEGTLPYAMNIVGLLTSGQRPDNYVELLKNGQSEDGRFEIGRLEKTEWAVIALDMAGADYDRENAVEYIIQDNSEEESVAFLAVAVTALSKHKDIDGVEEFINEKLDIIKSKQFESGGFESIDGAGEDSQAISYVISALVANEINPLTDPEWIKNDRTILDALLEYKKLNYFIYNDTYGDYMFKDDATEQALIALSDLRNNQSSYENVQDAVSYRALATESLFKLRNYLTTTDKRTNDSLQQIDVYYSWHDALAINHTSDDLDKDYIDIQGKLKIEDGKDVLSYAENIMGLIAAGEVLSKSEVDYVSKLVNLQDDNGKFKEEGKESNVYKQSYSIIALDMAQAEYDEEKAVESLRAMASGNNFGSVEETAWALIALSKYKDLEGVSNIIDLGLAYLNNNQSHDGGFDMMGYGDTPQYTALVIQALVANDVDPLSAQWTKVNGNLITSMINDQMDDGTFRMTEKFGDYVDTIGTERSFAALADLYQGESMYKGIEPQLDPSEAVKNTIKDVKNYYKEDQYYNYLQAMALNKAGIDKSEIASKLELRKDEAERIYIVLDNDVEMVAKDIMGIIGAGENPREYNGKNYVENLQNAQKENGEFKMEENPSISSQAYGIIALDMADAGYDVDKAISNLIEKYDNSSSKSVYTVSETIIALSNHKEIDGVEDKINGCIEDLNPMQMETGGFDYDDGGSEFASEVSEYDAIVIQALIAAGKDPLADDFKKNGNTILDGLMAFKRDDHFIYDSTKINYSDYTDVATGMVLAALIDLDNEESMYHSFAIEYEGPKTNDEKIDEAINDLRGHYFNDDVFTFREAMAYRYTSDDIKEDLETLQSKYSVRENPVQASDYATNIIGLIAVGKNPRNNQGENDVQTLMNAQEESGIFQIKQEGGYPTQTAWSMIALDMADAEYNKELAAHALMNVQAEDGSFGDIDTTAMTIMALANHKNVEGVEDCIDKALNYIKAEQTDTGGFIAWGSESPYTASTVIQGLIAVGEDPLSEEWTRNGKTILDFLLIFKVGDYFEYKSEWGTDMDSITEQAFMALADLDSEKSMYHELAIKYQNPVSVVKLEIQKPSKSTIAVNENLKLLVKAFDENDQEVLTEGIAWESSDANIATVDETGNVVAKSEGIVTITAKVMGNESVKDLIELTVEAATNSKFEITRVGEDIFRNGNEAKLQIRVKNNDEESQKATFVIALYDKENTMMINYSYVFEDVAPGQSKDMTAGFLVPADGNYEVRGFVWDSFEDQNILLKNPIVITVQK